MPTTREVGVGGIVVLTMFLLLSSRGRNKLSNFVCIFNFVSQFFSKFCGSQFKNRSSEIVSCFRQSEMLLQTFAFLFLVHLSRCSSENPYISLFITESRVPFV